MPQDAAFSVGSWIIDHSKRLALSTTTTTSTTGSEFIDQKHFVTSFAKQGSKTLAFDGLLILAMFTLLKVSNGDDSLFRTTK
jgi:hypothetical protein